MDDIEARLASVEERVEALPTVKREEDAATHAHAAFALLRAMLLSLPPAEARKVCDNALFFIGENPDGLFPEYLKDAIADVVRGVVEEIRS
ncbi:MAG: hypothetical protein HQL42_04035 [Alphaproteobacteria bacterium]|nr:hypothetical protein [Alphaproteobacteria bacterium]